VEAMRAERAQLETLVERAGQALGDAGYSASAEMRRRIGDTLLGAAADRHHAEALAHGRLTEELHAPGFDALTGAPRLRVVEGGAAQRDAKAAAKQRAREDEARERAARAEQRRQEAQARHREAEARAAEVAALEREAAAARERLAEVQSRLKAARRGPSRRPR
jgi:hypothetical protein